MARRYFNWKLAVVSVVALVVMGVAAFVLHGRQKATAAEKSLHLGDQAYAEGRWEEAADLLGRYLSMHADNILVWMKYADAYENIRPQKPNNVSRALGAYRAVLRREGGHDEATNRLVELYLTWGQPADANGCIVEYLKIKKDSPTLRRLRGIALVNLDKFNDAGDVLTQLLKDHPDEVLAYEVMGQLAGKQLAGKQPKDVNLPAARWFDEAVKQNPNSALAYIIRASFHLGARDPNAAMIDLDKAGTLDLSDTTVHLRLVGELLNAAALGKAVALDKAREHLEVLQAKLPKDLTAWQDHLMVWQYRAELARLSNSKEEMQQVARAGLKELASQRQDFLPAAAKLLITAGQFQDANDCVMQMRQKNLSPADVAFLQGLLARERRRLSETKTQWEEAIRLGYHLRYPQLRMDLADVLAQMGELQSAVAQLRALVADYPNPKYLIWRLGLMRMLAQSRDWTAVLEQSKKIQELVPGYGEAVLAEVQARIQLLAATSGLAAAQDGAWRDIESRLAQLDEATKGAAPVRLLRVQTAMLQTKYSQASTLLDELQSSGFDEVRVALLRAQLYVDQKKEQEAVSLLRKTMEKFPQRIEPVGYLAFLLNKPDKQQECESLVKEAMAAAQLPEIRRQLGLLLAELYMSWGKADQIQKGRTLLSDLMTQFPEDVQVMRHLLVLDYNTPGAQKIVDRLKSIEGENGWQWRYEQARVWFYSKDFKVRYTDIVQILKASLLARPNEPAIRLLLAAAHEKRGELQLALSAYREAWNLFPDDIQVIVRMVDALNKAGEATEAQDILAKAADHKDDPALQRLRSQNLLQLGDWDSASKALQDLAVSVPNNAPINLALANVLVRQKRYDEAQAILDRLKTKDSQSIEFMKIQVPLYIGQGNGEAAIKLCSETVKSRDNGQAYWLRALAYSLLNQPSKAIEDIQKALTRDANDLPTQQLAASLFINSGSRSLIRQAETLLDRWSAAHPEDLDLKYSRARVSLLKGTAPANERARRLLDEVTKGRPRFVEAWEQLGWLELREGQPGRAVDAALGGLMYSKQDKRLRLLKAQGEAARSSPIQAVPTLEALAVDYPNDADVALQLGDAYINSDRADKAVELLQQRVTNLKGTDRRRCDTLLAAALYRSGQKDNAIARFGALMQADPNDPLAVLMQAQLLGSDKRWADLKQLMADWTSRHPQDSATPTRVGTWLSESQGEPQAKEVAEELLRSSLKRNPNSSGTLHVLAILLQNSGRNREAIDMNRKALEVDPNSVIAMNNLAWLLCEDQKQYDEALGLADKGLQIEREYCDLIDTRGVVYYRKQRYEEAIRDLKQCIDLCPAGLPLVVQARFHLGRVYADMKRKTEAVEQISEAMKAQTRLDQMKQAGGLSQEDQNEAKRILDQLRKGGS